jgi:TrmH family RNA methyltransferase
VIEGLRLHERALRAGLTIELALVGASFQESDSERVQALLAGLADSGCRITIAPDAALKALTDGRGLGDILGLIPMPDPPTLDSLLIDNPLLLAAVNLVDPGNVGALARTGHAFGVTALLATGKSDPHHPRALRTAMGSLFRLPALMNLDPLPLIAQLRAGGVQCVGAVSDGGVPLPEAHFAQGGVALFMGSEYWGLPQEVVERLDLLVTIPMAEGIDSLSVNAATAAILYQIQQARRHSS